MRIYVVRHGETVANVEKRIQGQSDEASITERGVKQMHDVADFLKSQNLQYPTLWSSSLGRGMESARHIANTFGIAIVACDELHQRNWGNVQGSNYDIARSEITYFGEPGGALPPDAESSRAVISRLKAFLERIGNSGETDHIVVTHNETASYLLNIFTSGELRKRDFLNGEIVLVHIDDAGSLQSPPLTVFPNRLIYLMNVSSIQNDPEAMNLLRSAGLTPVSTVDDAIRDNVVGAILGDEKFGTEEAEPFRRLRAVCRYGVGVNNVGVDDLWNSRRIRVARTTGANSESVAQFTVAAITLLLRNILPHAQSFQAGLWRSSDKGIDLQDATVGLIGLGHIGIRVAQMLHGHGARVLAYTRSWPPHSAGGADISWIERVEDVGTMMKCCDAISLHVPFDIETRYIIGKKSLSQINPDMKRPVIVNTSRGGNIDNGALITALNDNRVRSAWLDVWVGEGRNAVRDKVTIALMKHPHVFASPHIAEHTIGVTHRKSMLAAEIISELIEGRHQHLRDFLCEPKK